jgi:hypothetical protein
MDMESDMGEGDMGNLGLESSLHPSFSRAGFTDKIPVPEI